MPNRHASNWAELPLSGLIAAAETAVLALWLPLLAGMAGHGTVMPNPAGLFVIGLAAFWFVRLRQTGRLGKGAGLLMLGSWLVLVAGGLILSIGPPIHLANLGGGWIVIVLGGIAWVRGSALAGAPDLATPERAHRLLGQGVLLIGAALMVSFVWHSPASAAARQTAWWAAPVLLLSALMLAAVGVADAVTGQNSGTATRQHAGATGFAAGLLLLAVALVVLFGGNASLIQSSVRPIAEAVAFVVFWLLVGLEYVVFYAIVGTLRLFGIKISFPKLPHKAIPNPQHHKKEHHAFPLWFELTLIVLAAILLIALLSWSLPRIMRFLRRQRSRSGVQVIQTRLGSSGSLFGDLRDLVPRLRHSQRHGVRVDLRAPPESVRDAYRKLLVLAAQEGLPRQSTESPCDFARRLGNAWVGLAGPIDDLTHCYVATRYGETMSDDDLSNARHAWGRIRISVMDSKQERSE